MEQYSYFDGVIAEKVSKPKKACKPAKPRAPEFPYLCVTSKGNRIVYAQHKYHAWAKCRGMYGDCLRDPIIVV